MNYVIAGIFHLCSDYLLLLGTDKLCGSSIRYERLLLSAIIGSLIASLELFPISALNLVVELSMVSYISFGKPNRNWGIFGLLRLALIGAGQGSAVSMILSTILVLILMILSFSSYSDVVDITVKGDCEVELRALRDTGNTLRDPVSGERVLVVNSDVSGKLIGLNRKQLENPLQTISEQRVSGLRIIPYHAIGKNGFLLAKRLPVAIGNSEKTVVVAFAPSGMEDGMFQAVSGGML